MILPFFSTYATATSFRNAFKTSCKETPNNTTSFSIKAFAINNPSTVVNMPGVVNKNESVIRNITDLKRPAGKISLLKKVEAAVR